MCTFLVVCTVGCALHYYDPDTGTEHVWGVGHIKMRIHSETNALQAVSSQVSTVGIGVGAGKEDYYLVGGYNKRGSLSVYDDTVLSLQWPTNELDLFRVRVGTNFPHHLDHRVNQ